MATSGSDGTILEGPATGTATGTGAAIGAGAAGPAAASGVLNAPYN